MGRGIRLVDTTSASRQRGLVQSVARAFRVLHSVAAAREGKRLTDVSAELRLPKATTLRLLRTLVAESVLAFEPVTGRYVMAAHLWLSLDPYLGPARSLIASVQGILNGLAERTSAVCLIAVPDVTRRRCYPVMSAVPDGQPDGPDGARESLPLHLCASGKCYLAGLSDQALASYLADLATKRRRAGSASLATLKQELARVRRQGYAVGRGGPDGRSRSVAAPLIAPEGAVAGGVELLFRGSEPNGGAALANRSLLCDSADLISHMLSDRSWSAHAGAICLRRHELATPWDTPDPTCSQGPTVLVRSVSRAVRMMAALMQSPTGASLSELMERRQLDRNAAVRLLRTLERQGVVRREPATRRYRVSPMLWLRLSSALGAAGAMADATARILKQVAVATGATACLVMLDRAEDTAVVVQHAFPARSLCYQPVTGQRRVLHASAAGKCLLAHRSCLQIKEYMQGGLRRLTENTIASPERLAAELRAVVKQGYAVSCHGAVRGLGGIALPVFGLQGEVVAALNLVPLADEMTESNVQAWLPTLRAAALSLSKTLGAGTLAPPARPSR